VSALWSLLSAGAPRRLLLDLQVHIHRARHLALAHQWHHLATSAFIQCRQLLLRLVEIRYLALGQRRHAFADASGRFVAGADHAQLADRRLLHLQQHHAATDLLLGKLDVDRLIARLLIERMDRIARLLDIGQGLARAEERFHRALNAPGIEHGIAAHDVFVDVHAGRRRRLLREQWQRHRG